MVYFVFLLDQPLTNLELSMGFVDFVPQAKVSMHLTEPWATYRNQVYRWYRPQTIYLSMQILPKYLNSFASKQAWLDFACSCYDGVVVLLVRLASRYSQFITTRRSFLFPARPKLTSHSSFLWKLNLVKLVLLHVAVGGVAQILPPSELSQWQLQPYLFWLMQQSQVSWASSTFLFPRDQPFV